MKNAGKLQALVALAFLGAGVMLAGCKSAPELSKDQALALIQAKYDSMPAAPVNISVNDMGMQEGVNAKYWVGMKRYPNGYWGDFQLTPEGKKMVTLAGGGDMILWRPEQPKDPRYMITVTTVANNHLKARDISDVQDDGGGGKSATFTEEVNLTGVPDALQGIAHNPGNRLSQKRTAAFVLKDGAWALQSID